MRQLLETNKSQLDTINDLAKLFQGMGICHWVPLPAERGPGFTVKFRWNGKWIPVTSVIQPTSEQNLRMCYRALHHVFEMEVRGITGLVQKTVSEMGLVPAGENHDGLAAACAILGVRRGASVEEIKHAYRKKVKLVHPDHGGDEDLFKALQRAYENLELEVQSGWR